MRERVVLVVCGCECVGGGMRERVVLVVLLLLTVDECAVSIQERIGVAPNSGGYVPVDMTLRPCACAHGA